MTRVNMAEYKKVDGWNEGWEDNSLRFAQDGNGNLVLLYDSPEFGRMICARVWKEGALAFVEMSWNNLGTRFMRRVIDMVDEFFGIDH